MKRFDLIQDAGQRRKAKRGKCITKQCRNRVPECLPGFICHKCRMARWRKNNPLKAAYANLRDHATQRGIAFRLTFKHFRKVAVKAGYIQGLDGARGLSVDRTNDHERVYRNGKIRVITGAENRAKENRIRARLRAGLPVNGYPPKELPDLELPDEPF